MIDHEHFEICQADYNELVFLESCRAELRKMGFYRTHPLNTDQLPRAAPQPTHYLRYTKGMGYETVPIPQYERQEAQR